MAALEGAEAAPRHGERHGGGDGGDDGPGAGRRPRGGGAGAVRLLPLGRRGPAAALRRRLHPRRRHATSTPGARRVRPETKAFLLESPPTRRWRSSTSPRSPRSPMRPARRSSSTTCSPRRSSRSRWRWAPTASSIRPPSTSTARADVSAAPSSARRSSSRRRCSNSCAYRPVDLAVQCLGPAEGAGDPAAARRARRPRTPAFSPMRSPTIRRFKRLIYPGRADHPQAELIASR